jgi:hypothetical protein
MLYVCFLIIVVCVFLSTKWYYYAKGFDKGVEYRNDYFGWAIRNSADWFNMHQPIVGNTLFEIGNQILAYGSFRIEKVRDLVDSQKSKRYHLDVNQYTKPTKNGI